jgi:hypothetical protein
MGANPSSSPLKKFLLTRFEENLTLQLSNNPNSIISEKNTPKNPKNSPL